MLDENSVNVFVPLSGKENAKHDIGMFLISKDIDDFESEYYNFNVKSLTLSRVDDMIKFMLDNNISSVRRLVGASKKDFVMKLETVLKISKSPETIFNYQKLLLKNKKPTL